MSGTATLPLFVAEIDRLSDELELFGFPRMLPPEFMPTVYPNGKMEMQCVKVLDLLHALMDSLWAMIQAKHRDRELRGDGTDENSKLSFELKSLETDFKKLQVKVKKKNHELCVWTKEAVELKSCQKELTSRIAVQDEAIRSLKSQLRHAHKTLSARLVAKDVEIGRLKERLRQALGMGISHGSRRPTESEGLKAAREEASLLRSVILNYQSTNQVLVGSNLELQRKKETSEEPEPEKMITSD